MWVWKRICEKMAWSWNKLCLIFKSASFSWIQWTIVWYPGMLHVVWSCAFPYQCDTSVHVQFLTTDRNTKCNNSWSYTGFSQCGYTKPQLCMKFKTKKHLFRLFEIHFSSPPKTPQSPLKVQTPQEVKPPVIARQFLKLHMATSVMASLM